MADSRKLKTERDAIDDLFEAHRSLYMSTRRLQKVTELTQDPDVAQ